MGGSAAGQADTASWVGSGFAPPWHGTRPGPGPPPECRESRHRGPIRCPPWRVQTSLRCVESCERWDCRSRRLVKNPERMPVFLGCPAPGRREMPSGFRKRTHPARIREVCGAKGPRPRQRGVRLSCKAVGRVHPRQTHPGLERARTHSLLWVGPLGMGSASASDKTLPVMFLHFAPLGKGRTWCGPPGPRKKARRVVPFPAGQVW